MNRREFFKAVSVGLATAVAGAALPEQKPRQLTTKELRDWIENQEFYAPPNDDNWYILVQPGEHYAS